VDICNTRLNSHILNDIQSETDLSCLLWLDENFEPEDFNLSAMRDRVSIVTNRVNHVEELQADAFDVKFNDFSLKGQKIKFDRVYFRVSKERLVSHHCINESAKRLRKKGQFVLVGKKEDGVKTYFSKLTKELGFKGELKKDKDSYLAVLSPTIKRNELEDLETNDYNTLRQVNIVSLEGADYSLWSKPGVFSWKKLDAGSDLLCRTLMQPIHRPTLPPKTSKALDLGSGSGHLSLLLHALGAKHIVATDSNAAACLATEKTLKENRIKADVIADDVASKIEEKFDLIVCNPPFHKGFSSNKSLTEKFSLACYRLLAPHGQAYFVTNVFIGIEKYLFQFGLKAKTITENKQFKVIKITHR